VSKYFTTIFKKLVPAGHAVLVMKKDTGDVSQMSLNTTSFSISIGKKASSSPVSFLLISEEKRW